MRPGRITVGVLLLIGLCLLAAPGAGRAIGDGDTVFDYEMDLDLSGIAEDGDFLAKYFDNDPTKGVIFSLPVWDAAAMDLTQIDMQGNYGTYFVVLSGSVPGARIYIRDPTVYFDVVLDNDLTYSISGRSVTQDTPIAFKFDATEIGTFLPTATVQVKITAPDGSTLTSILDADGNAQDLTGHVVSAPRTYIRDIDISQLELGTYIAQAKWESPQGFADYATNSNSVSFNIGYMETAIVSNMENVFRNDPFVVTITGDFRQTHYVFIEDAGTAADRYPFIKAGQPSVTITDEAFAGAADPAADTLANSERAIAGGVYVPCTAAVVTMSSIGTRSIEFCTNDTTEKQTFTIKVLDPRDPIRCDEVTVTVEKGAVTIDADENGICYFGDEIRLYGTNTESGTVYLFLTSPGVMPATGIALDNISAHAADGEYTVCSTGGGGSFEYRWDTSVLAPLMDEGTCRVYAVSSPTDETGAPVDADHLEGVVHATTDIVLKRPFISVSTSETDIQKGGSLTISGQATGNPPAVQVWIIGEGCWLMGEQVSIPAYYMDGRWSYSLQAEDTINFSGDYYVIAQHPMIDGKFGVRPLHPENRTDARIIDANGTITDLAALPPAGAAQAVADAIFSPSCDDTAAKVSFHVEESRYIDFDTNVFYNEGRLTDGRVLFKGRSNYPIGTPLSWMVTPYNGTAVLKSGVTDVQSISYDSWQFDLDLKTLAEGDYTVTVASPDKSVSDRLNFTLYVATDQVYPESANFGVEYAFVYPSLAEPFLNETSTRAIKAFTVLATLKPGAKDRTPFPSGDSLQINNLQNEKIINFDPIHYTIAVNGNDVSSEDDYWTITINGWDLAYPAGVDVDVYIKAQCHAGPVNTVFYPSAPVVDGLRTVTLLNITQMEGGSTPIPGGSFMINLTAPDDGGGSTPVVPPDCNSTAITISPGWNFVSTPKTLAIGKDTTSIFAGVDTAGHSIFRYDTPTATWVPLKPTDTIRPLEGYWIYAAAAAEVPLSYTSGTPQAPPERALTAGWNAIGFSDTRPAAARDALVSLGSAWSVLIGFDAESQIYETSIIRGGSGEHSDAGWMLPAKGYWLYMTGDGTLAAIGA